MHLPIVYFYPGAQWDLPPGRHRLIMEAISAYHPVIFLDTPRFRGEYFEAIRPTVERRSENLAIVHNAFGLRYARLGRKLKQASAAIDAAWLHSALRSLGVTDYIYWLSANAREALWGMKTNRLVFDVIDPCFETGGQAEFDRLEESIARKARTVFCTAETLYEKLQKIHPHVYLIPNACAPATYLPEATRGLSLPKALEQRTRPIIGFMGTFDWRVDTVTLTEAAKRLPEYTFALPGRINADQEEKVRELRSLPNVVMPGSVSEEEGFAYTAAFDVGLIPFIPGEMNDAINPVKMWMYLVAGKPVVTTWVRECYRQAPYVQATHTVEEFVAAIRQSVTANDAIQNQARIDFALQNSWDVRAQDALRHLYENGLLEAPVGKPQKEAF